MALGELDKKYSLEFAQRFPDRIIPARRCKRDAPVSNLAALSMGWLTRVEGEHNLTARRAASLAIGAAALDKRIQSGIDTRYLVPAAVRRDYVGGVPCPLYVELLPYGFSVVLQDDKGPQAVGALFYGASEQFDAGLALYDYVTQALYPIAARTLVDPSASGIAGGTIMPRARKLV